MNECPEFSAIVGRTPFLILEVDVGAPTVVGPMGTGIRRFVPINGGTVSGAIEGTIIPGGVDWQIVRDDGNLEISAHYAFRGPHDAVVEIQSRGVRAAPAAVQQRLQAGEALDPQQYYFRTAMRFHTGAPRFSFLNMLLAISRGDRRASSVRLEVFKVL
jgi:hypothetical protein